MVRKKSGGATVLGVVQGARLPAKPLHTS